MRASSAVDSAIVTRRAGPVAIVTIRNPAKRNAFSVAMLDRLDAVLSGFAADDQLRALVVTGAGEDFSAGMDIRELASARARGVALEHRMAATEQRLAAFPKPTIAAISGHCVGGGIQVAMACDLRVAGHTARFGITPAKLGIVYPAATVARLTRTLGPAVAKRLLFTAELIDAPTALRLGVVGELTEGDGPVARALELAHLICTRSPVSVAAAKEGVDAVCAEDIDDAVVRRWESLSDVDAPEGIEAFLSRRAPRFGA